MAEEREIDEQITLEPGDDRIEDIHDAAGNVIARVRLVVHQCEDSSPGGGPPSGGGSTEPPFVPIGDEPSVRTMVERLLAEPSRLRVSRDEEGGDVFLRFSEAESPLPGAFAFPAKFEPQESEDQLTVRYRATVDTGDPSMSLGPDAKGIVMVFETGPTQ